MRKHTLQTSIVAAILMTFVALAAQGQGEKADTPYDRTVDLVYGDSNGTGLVMDIFVPKTNKNGFAIIDIGSGAWHSDRGKLKDHQKAGFYDVFCGHGYTVFAIRPGSQTKYTAEEMVANIQQGIKWVRGHAADYKIDANKLGIVGASAGAHLTLLTLLTTKEETGIVAAGLFFPPTDFLDWGEQIPLEHVGNLLFNGGIAGKSPEEIKAKAASISPARLPIGNVPPMLFFHGDADPLVPLQQSQKMVKLLQDAGKQAELIIKPGGEHPWPTIAEEVAKMADWFDKQIKVK
jgi:acetyl esterase/lipase